MTETRAASSEPMITRPDEAEPASTDAEAPTAPVEGPAGDTAEASAPETAAAPDTAVEPETAAEPEAAAEPELATEPKTTAVPVDVGLSDSAPQQQPETALPQVPATAASGTPDGGQTPPNPSSSPSGGGAAFEAPADSSNIRGADAASGLRGTAGGFGSAPMGLNGSDSSGSSSTPTRPIEANAPREPDIAPTELAAGPIVLPAPLLHLSPLAIEENDLGAAVATVRIQNTGKRSFTIEVDDDRFTVIDGKVRLKDELALDHEAEPSVDLTLTATATDGTTLVASLGIDVGGVNEVPAAVDLSAASVAENAASAVIGTLTTSDVDDGDSASYSVDDERFEVATGQLELKDGQSLDHEQEATVDIEVTSTDTGNLSRSETFTITVADVNETLTAIAISSHAVAGFTGGTVVGTLSTSDPDSQDSHTYALSGDDRFEIVQGNQLKLKDRAAIDRAVESEVEVIVTTTDSGDLSHQQILTLSVESGSESLGNTETAGMQTSALAYFTSPPR